MRVTYYSDDYAYIEEGVVGDIEEVEVYINPRYVVRAWPDTREIAMHGVGRYDGGLRLTEESFDRVVAWMEAHE